MDDPMDSAKLTFPAVSRFGPGDTIAPRELTTIRSEQIRVPAREGLTHLQFRRFAGCPICNLHLRSVVGRHDEIVAAGISEVVVFHSSVEDMLPHQGELPFAAIADPDRELYTLFGDRSHRPPRVACPVSRADAGRRGHRAGTAGKRGGDGLPDSRCAGRITASGRRSARSACS
jgi:hypothetical protein